MLASNWLKAVINIQMLIFFKRIGGISIHCYFIIAVEINVYSINTTTIKKNYVEQNFSSTLIGEFTSCRYPIGYYSFFSRSQ